MAAIQTEKNYVEIVLVNDEMKETILKIDNPQSTLSLTDVRQAFAGVIPGSIEGTTPQLLFDRNNRPFKMVTQAIKMQVITTAEELEED